jgi:hypothetical protein
VTTSFWELDPTAAGLSVGRYIVTVEAGYIESTEGCIAGVREASTTFYLVHTVDAVAPGQALAGESVRIYGSGLYQGDPASILLDDDPNDGAAAIVSTVTPGGDGFADVTLPAEATPGTYYVAVALTDGTCQSIWKQALEVVSPGYQVSNEEDPSCGGAGTECSHPIVPGQTVTGNWFEPGDVDYYYFTAAAGTTFDISLHRVDESLSIHHPDAVDPELMVADPDGMVDSGKGYANDFSAADSNAVLTGYVTPKSGLYLLVSRSAKGFGDYTLTLTRTGTSPSTGNGAVAYGDRAVSIVEAPGEANTATLQAIVLDPQGLPAAGAQPAWQVLDGSISDAQISSSHFSGVAQGVFTIASGGTAGVAPSYDWPTQAKAAAMALEKQTIVIPPTGAIVGLVRHDSSGAVYYTRLPGAYEIAQIKQAADQIAVLGSAGSQSPAAAKDLALAKAFQCVDLEANRQEVTAIAMPDGAATIDSLTFELTDDAGNPINQPLSDLSVTELANLQVRLLAHCTDTDGAAMAPVPLPGAELAIQVADLDPAFTRGVVSGDTTCPSAVISTTGELTPIDIEVGTRSIFKSLDGAGEAQFATVELIAASTAIKTRAADETWLVLAADTVVEVAPMPDSPAQIGWIGSPDHTMPESFLSRYEEQIGSLTQYTQYVNGPRFYLLDTYGNAVILWGAGDTDPWHRDPTGEVYLPSPGEWGTPPWAAVRFEPESSPVFYRLWQFCSDPYIMGTPPTTVYTGFQQWQVCADPGDGGAPICSTFSLDNSQSMNWIYTQWPFLTDDINTGVGGEVLDHYVDGAEWSDPSSWTTSPGQPLLFQPSGKPVLLRIDPATTDDQYSPHSTTFDNVPVRVWVSGPVTEPGAIHFGRESPDDPYEPIKAEDVEICVGNLTYSQTAEYPLVGTCDQKFVGEATFDAFTDPGPDGLIDGQLFASAFGISKAPQEPGIYTIVVETDDPRFSEYSQVTKNWNYFGRWHYSFEVLGGWFLDESYNPIDETSIISERTVYLDALLPNSGDQLSVNIYFDDISGEHSNSYTVSLSIFSSEWSTISKYRGEITIRNKAATGQSPSKESTQNTIELEGPAVGRLLASLVKTFAKVRTITHDVKYLRADGLFKPGTIYDRGYIGNEASDPDKDKGRIYMNWVFDENSVNKLKWSRGFQRVDLTAAILPVDDISSDYRVLWIEIDEDDPSDTWAGVHPASGAMIDPEDWGIDPLDPYYKYIPWNNLPHLENKGGDNHGFRNSIPKWEQAKLPDGSDDPRFRMTTEIDYENGLGRVAFTEISNGMSRIRFNATNVSGDNYKIRAILVKGESIQTWGPEDVTGLMTVWKRAQIEHKHMEEHLLPVDQLQATFNPAFIEIVPSAPQYTYRNLEFFGSGDNPDTVENNLNEFCMNPPVGEFEHKSDLINDGAWFFSCAARNMSTPPEPPSFAIPIAGIARRLEDTNTLELLDEYGDLPAPDELVGWEITINKDTTSEFTFTIESNTERTIDVEPYYWDRHHWAVNGSLMYTLLMDDEELGYDQMQEFHFTIGDGTFLTVGIAPSDGCSIVFIEPFKLKFGDNPDMFNKEVKDTTIHELVHAFDVGHICGLRDIYGQYSCVMNYTYNQTYKFEGGMGPLESRSTLCATHIIALRKANGFGGDVNND